MLCRASTYPKPSYNACSRCLKSCDESVTRMTGHPSTISSDVPSTGRGRVKSPLKVSEWRDRTPRWIRYAVCCATTTTFPSSNQKLVSRCSSESSWGVSSVLGRFAFGCLGDDMVANGWNTPAPPRPCLMFNCKSDCSWRPTERAPSMAPLPSDSPYQQSRSAHPYIHCNQTRELGDTY